MNKFNIKIAVSNPMDAISTAFERMFPIDSTVKRVARWKHGKVKRVDLLDLITTDKVSEVTLVNPVDRISNTSVTIYELLCINSLVKYTNPKVAFEIGTFNGNTTINIASNVNENSVIYTLDLPEDWDGNYEINVPIDHENVTDRATVGGQIKSFKYKKNIRQIYGDSAKFDWLTIPNPLQFVFIDGNHCYEYVKNDSVNAISHISKGGCIVWHDYGEFPDVCKAVDELSSEIDIVAIEGTRLAYAKF